MFARPRTLPTPLAALLIALASGCGAPAPLEPTGNAEDLVRAWQASSGLSVTYDESTALAMQAREVALPGDAGSATPEELEDRLGELGFHLRPVGPPHLEVWIVEPSAL